MTNRVATAMFIAEPLCGLAGYSACSDGHRGLPPTNAIESEFPTMPKDWSTPIGNTIGGNRRKRFDLPGGAWR